MRNPGTGSEILGWRNRFSGEPMSGAELPRVLTLLTLEPSLESARDLASDAILSTPSTRALMMAPVSVTYFASTFPEVRIVRKTASSDARICPNDVTDRR